jgi:hypothetical protein
MDPNSIRIGAQIGIKTPFGFFTAKAIEDMVGARHTALYGNLNKLVQSGQIKIDSGNDGKLMHLPR